MPFTDRFYCNFHSNENFCKTDTALARIKSPFFYPAKCKFIRSQKSLPTSGILICWRQIESWYQETRPSQSESRHCIWTQLCLNSTSFHLRLSRVDDLGRPNLGHLFSLSDHRQLIKMRRNFISFCAFACLALCLLVEADYEEEVSGTLNRAFAYLIGILT
jgi:hypothetical protein